MKEKIYKIQKIDSDFDELMKTPRCLGDRFAHDDFCKCTHIASITSEEDENGFGYWDVCCGCGKRIENGHHYYNHYDGEDHDDIDEDIWR